MGKKIAHIDTDKPLVSNKIDFDAYMQAEVDNLEQEEKERAFKMIMQAPPPAQIHGGYIIKSGKENRRERRAKERKQTKKQTK